MSDSTSVPLALETIDAAMFSGDYFYSKDEVEKLKYYLDRWNSEVKNVEEFLKEVSE